MRAVEPLIAQGHAGVQVLRVYAGTYANAANMAAGDVLVSVNGQPVANSSDLTTALAPVREGQSLNVSVVRRETLFTLTAPASRRAVSGELSDAIKLGVEIGPTIQDVSYGGGVRIANVASGSPAATTLRAGDVVVAVKLRSSTQSMSEPQPIHEVRELEAFLGEARASEDIAFSLLRGPTPLIASVRLDARAGKREL